MALKDSFATIRYFTAADVYYYTTDNRPLTDLKTCLDFLGDTLDTGFTTGTVKVADGLVGTPSITYTTDATTGFYKSAASEISITLGGIQRHRFSAGSIQIIGGSASINFAGLTNVVTEGGQILSQQNGVNPQILRIYNTFTDASNYERFEMAWASNLLILRTAVAGTGTARSVAIEASNGTVTLRAAAGTDHWRVNNAGGNPGRFEAATDNSYDMGQIGANRARSVYLGSRIVTGESTVTYSASMTPDASLGNLFIITATNGTAFAINAPTNPTTGQIMTVLLRNTSGGALGAATWNAVFKMTAWTNPLNTFSRSIQFRYDGTNWVEINRGAADVPN